MSKSSKVAQNRERRKAEIVARARTYFARVGLEGTTRGLAKELGCSQAMFYRYFPNTEDLISNVFSSTFDETKYGLLPELKPDSGVPLREQLSNLLYVYCTKLMSEEWIRLFFFASLSGYTDPYVTNKQAITKSVLFPICQTVRAEIGYDEVDIDRIPISDVEFELAWRPFGGVIYNMIRVHIFKIPLKLPLMDIISEVVDQHMDGWYSNWPR